LIPASTNAEVYTPGTTNSSQLQALLSLIRQPEEKIILRKNGELLRQKDEEEEEDIKEDNTVEQIKQRKCYTRTTYASAVKNDDKEQVAILGVYRFALYHKIGWQMYSRSLEAHGSRGES
jgi:hypothetical protein